MKKIFREEVIFSNDVAIIGEQGERITYKELAERAELYKDCMEERSLVFVLCDRQVETVEFLYELFLLNRVPLLLAEDIHPKFLEELLMQYHPQYIYCNRQNKIVNRLEPVIEMQGHVLFRTGYERISLHHELALLLSTSGTTGSSKLVRISYENLFDNSEFACRHLNIEKGQKGVTVLPLNYTYGLSFYMWHWHCGAAVLVTDRMVLDNRFKDFYVREKANNFAAVPETFQMMRRVQFWEKDMLEYLHFAMSGGGQMSARDQIQMVSALKEKFWIGFGQTECTCIVSGTNFIGGKMRLETIGKAFSNMNVWLDRETDELIVKSRSVCLGYAEGIEDLAVGDQNRGILHTGDAAYIDEDGYLYLKGRLKRYIKILGKRVSLDEMEKVIKNEFFLDDLVCVGWDDHVTIFYSERDKSGTECQVRQFLDRELKIPQKFIQCFFLEEIPKNNAGKVQYEKLKELANGKKDT